ncbi:MAG: shikimate kinase [Candidatus Levybacteria bacterium]|nr:shikimate kinase [Candidatus Levybacteria bacterium]MDZ4228419.1 shikimate kinase [Candidatus Levybacteria bacterium]
MKLSKLQFEQLLQNNELMLSFVGMSNIGKTYWSKKLHSIGLRHFSCDDLIEAKLGPILNELGYAGIEDVSRWMGQPYDQKFETNQQKYLSLEQEVMEDIFAQVKNGKKQNTVIDTTGSVIHTNRNICDRLKQYSMVVYIEAPESMQEKMFKQYIKEPKPVVFGDIYNPQDNETETQTLSRCYRELLIFRSTLYSKCADVIIPREAIEKNMNVQQFISLIKQSL